MASHDSVSKLTTAALVTEMKTVDLKIIKQLTRVLCYGILGGLVAVVPVLIIYNADPQNRWVERTSLALVALVCLWLLRTDHVRTAARFALWGLWSILIVLSFFHGGVRAPAMYLVVLLVSFSAVALGLRHTIAICILTAIACIGMLFFANSDALISEQAYAAIIIIFAIVTAILFLAAAKLLRRFALEAAQETFRRVDSQNYLDSIVHSVNGIVWEADAETLHFTFVSQAAEHLLGYPTDDWLGDKPFWQEHIHPDDRDNAVQRCHQATKEKKNHTFDYRMLAADGRVVWLRDIVTVVLQDNEPHRLRGVMVEITASKAAEERQREAQARLSLVVQAAHIGWWYWDLTTNRVEHSPESLALLGYVVGELSSDILERNLEDLLHPDDRIRVTETLGAFLDEPPDGTFLEYRMRHKDGTYRWIHTRATQLPDQSGRPARILGVQQDITERKNAEQTALRSQRLEGLGKLSSGVAHDLNNSLAPILMGIELLRMQYPGASNIIDILEQSAKRGTDIVRQLLTYAKGSEGDHVPVQFEQLINELYALMKASFPKDIELEVICEKKLPTVLGDATQLHQILLNLAVNARDAMPHGGRLTVKICGMEVGPALAALTPEAMPGNYVKLQVSDTGTGISPDVVDKIFDPFFSTKALDKGTGLGLSTVMGIVRGHGGFLEVDTLLGGGSTFTVYIPVSAACADQPSVVKNAVEFHAHGETILFVDDELVIRKVARAVLQRLKLTPLIAIDGADALIQVVDHRTQLRAVITDLHMPRMGGLDFVRALRQMLPDIPIAVSSGGKMDDVSALAFSALDVKYFLDKPFTEAQMAEVLQAMLGDAQQQTLPTIAHIDAPP